MNLKFTPNQNKQNMTTAEPYPRPDFIRPTLSWQSLNGDWNFAFDDSDVGLQEQWYNLKVLPKARSINVPYVFQTAASGIQEGGNHEFLWYSHVIPNLLSTEHRARGDRLIIRFGAVDYESMVWVNGTLVGSHRGGNTPFDVDVTGAVLQDANAHITLRVRDSPSDLTQPRGKQYWKPKPESIWYTPSSGIWQNVWAEILPATRLGHSGEGFVIRGDDITNGTVVIHAPVVGKREKELEIEVEILQGGKSAGKAKSTVNESTNIANITVQLDTSGGLALWTPETPSLYDVTVKLIRKSVDLIDSVNTYVGMRSLDWSGDLFKLNGKSYFQALVLDQGYWPESGLTPPSHEALRTDILLSKGMGFNGCRKHQKVEDPFFLYYTDTIGFLVWGEIANAYEFDSTYVERFNEEWVDAVKRDINHPSVVTWTPVNETWGYPQLPESIEQKNHIRNLYFLTKTLDPTRPINDNCGWEHVQTDLITFHDYSDIPELTKRCDSMDGILKSHINKLMFVRPIADAVGEERNSSPPVAPVLCTEFGGLNIRPAEGAQAKEGDWGYITADDPKDLLKRLEGLCVGIVKSGLICGFVYTQLTDIEQEVNGLYSYNREPKLEAASVAAVMEKSKQIFYKLHPQ